MSVWQKSKNDQKNQHQATQTTLKPGRNFQQGKMNSRLAKTSEKTLQILIRKGRIGFRDQAKTSSAWISGTNLVGVLRRLRSRDTEIFSKSITQVIKNTCLKIN